MEGMRHYQIAYLPSSSLLYYNHEIGRLQLMLMLPVMKQIMKIQAVTIYQVCGDAKSGILKYICLVCLWFFVQ